MLPSHRVLVIDDVSVFLKRNFSVLLMAVAVVSVTVPGSFHRPGDSMRSREARQGLEAAVPAAEGRSATSLARAGHASPSIAPRRTFQEAIDGSPRLVAQSRAIGALFDDARTGRGHAGGGTVPGASSSPSVAQRVLNTELEEGRLHVIGEDHRKTVERRQLEAFFADEHQLGYMTEEEFDIPATQQRGDPTPLRILFALARIRDLTRDFDRAAVHDRAALFAPFTYVIETVTGDFDRYALPGAPIRQLFQAMSAHLRNQQMDEARTDIEEMVQIVDPGKMLGSASGLAVARSLAMHEAATAQPGRAVMWMVGRRHVEDIDREHPDGRNYLLLDDAVLDALAQNVQVVQGAQDDDVLLGGPHTGVVIEELEDEDDGQGNGTGGATTSAAVVEEVD
ncbi:hypothetical protein [Roseateles amylovorans]|uniref:Uncharacterized protein n=1 Tax=Roseateles amylovorans TaxID=2978473 RepID=A0ABY6B632_9BURK|nr:hypothetical protein [Roseateles amylovorans]UXH79980.1 hypothetical protein N4261_08910 [Roseateles amylovorans]